MRQYKLCIQKKKNNNNNNNNNNNYNHNHNKKGKKQGADGGREGESVEVRYFIFNFFSFRFFLRSTKIGP